MANHTSKVEALQDESHDVFGIYIFLDQSDLDLRYSLANLVAMIVGSPSQSNHLWYHLFAPQELKKTYLTGYLVSTQFNNPLSLIILVCIVSV